MKRLRGLSDKSVLELSEDIIIEILHLLPSKSVARFECVCKHWQKCIADRLWIMVVEISKMESSPQNDWLLLSRATRQHFDVHVTQTSCIRVAAIGFHYKVDDPEEDNISFTIVRYEKSLDPNRNVTIESFSSERTTINLTVDLPLGLLCPTSWMKDSSAGVIDGVFCWMDELRQIILYDSVNRHLWGLKLTHEMKQGYSTRVLGVSDGVLHCAMHNEAKVTVWCLKSDIRSQDAVWVKKYTTTLGVLSYLIHVIPVLAEVTSMEFHPDNPHILYFLVNGKFLSYDSENHNAELLYDIRKHTSKAGLFYLFFRYEWHQWPRLLKTYQLAEK